MKVEIAKPAADRHPNLRAVKQVTLKDGPQVRKIAKITDIQDQHSGAFHHDTLSLKTYKMTKVACTFVQERSLSLEGGEITKLSDFLLTARGGDLPDRARSFLVLDAGRDAQTLRQLTELGDSAKLDALATLMRQAASTPGVLAKLAAKLSEDQSFLEKAATALNLEVYCKAVAELNGLIETSDREADFQRLLEANPWIFGSEYSAVLDRRRWTRDEQVDFLTRRTTSGVVELIEIKTPMPTQLLFVRDRSHNTLYPSAELSKVIAQCQNYLEKLDRQRDAILANDEVDVTKICAKVIIGRDGDAEQQAALRRLNGHLHRIQVITYDGLLAIARRVLAYLEGGSA
ncbi:DUF4263 domain-containing protein [Bosea sp. SSUT16]|uniref:DUF4263 domain-containing protein n=1 Tax=Bosea spartocytisi TaxID=2773451 RepID=A0A927ECF3_9HYPH|nr:Shedu anti-phage system protein SduA domain-containing protein [Bosea spartocytisi]MBD3846154.1 DUF4263 domain-containing protein [Bosea spartocytisi]MCT4473338.1 DUF4263 domain-containing protein [Bosea spartocytisi]